MNRVGPGAVVPRSGAAAGAGRGIDPRPSRAPPPRGRRLLPIEVKTTSRPRLGDAAHLRAFRTEYGKKARAGLLLHTGSRLEWLMPDVLATTPLWRVV